MSRVRYTNLARTDLTDIWVRIALHDQASANRVVDAITERCNQLSDFPKLGPARPEIAPNVRVLIVERWLVLYRMMAADVQIVRIVDGARDLAFIELPENRET